LPEGDTLRVLVADLAPALVGERILGLKGTHRAVAGEGKRVHGTSVTDVRAIGKNLVIEFDNEWALRTHLGMTGRWHRYRPGQHWHESPAKARVILETRAVVAVGFAIPTVELGPRPHVLRSLARLGPDLSDPAADLAPIVARARASTATNAGDLLLDQEVAAGIGNVYKSEIAFLEMVHPQTPPATLSDDEIMGLYTRARRLLVANTTTHHRSTTGDRRRGRRAWVYGRRGQPCRRCGRAIETTESGYHARITYWCPGCQQRGAP